MICDVCREQEATVQLTHVVKGDVTMLHLCPRCAAERGVETTVTTPPKNLLGEFLHSVQQQATAEQIDAMACGFCRMTLKDFRATGRLGCAHCYETFETPLRELLRRVHHSAKHVGRTYAPPAPDTVEGPASVGDLRDRLRRAIANEEFELAASLRDQLRVLE
ncbi:MAG: Protein-arginine kinase activator protein [Gemmatimonadaceae bacterium]|nr:Protein-arginine kinase activator protein [Gemmatimonadaceae bacterium]